MTSNDRGPNENPVGEFAAAARRIEALKAEVIATLVRGAFEGQTPVAETVAEASRIIVSTLTEISDVLLGAQGRRAAAAEQSAALETVAELEPAPMAEPPVHEQPQPTGPVRLNPEELEAGLQQFLTSGRTGITSVGRIAFTLGGGRRLDAGTYRALLGRLNAHPNTAYIGDGRYNIMPQDNDTAAAEAEETPGSGTEPPADETTQDSELPGDTSEDDDEEREPSNDVLEIEMVSRFMGRRPYFTGNQLRQFLIENELVAPGSIQGNKIHAYIEEITPYVEEYWYDKGDTIILSDSTIDRQTVIAAMEGRTPQAKTYVLGFKPRTVLKVGKRFIPVRPQGTGEPVVAETSAAETEGQRERAVTIEQTQAVVDAVANVGDELRLSSLLDILTDPEGLNLPEETARGWISAAITDGVVFRQGKGGHPHVTLYPPSRREPETPVDTTSIEYIEHEVDKYEFVASIVMDTLLSFEAEEGRPYVKLWNINRERLKGRVSYEEFNAKIHNMERDGLVMATHNVKLKQGKKMSRMRRGTKIRAASVAVRTEWRDERTEIIRRLRDNELNRLLS